MGRVDSDAMDVKAEATEWGTEDLYADNTGDRGDANADAGETEDVNTDTGDRGDADANAGTNRGDADI